MSITYEDIIGAYEKIKPYVRHTPLERSDYFSDQMDGEIYFKCENLQKSNSFKIRGALNAILSLDKTRATNGIVTASAGNHGQGIGFGSKLTNIPATIVVPKTTPITKIDAIKRYGVNLLIYGNIYDETEEYAINLGKTKNLVYISPYNHPHVIAGQGTIGLEIMEDIKDVDVILIPVGGGGLFSGISIAVKSIDPRIKCYGIQAEACPVIKESLKVGKLIDVPMQDSIAEGVLGGVEKGAITFPIIQKYCEDILLVNETEIKAAILDLIKEQHLITEGSGALSLAALKRYSKLFSGKTVVLILSGANIDYDVIKSLMLNDLSSN